MKKQILSILLACATTVVAYAQQFAGAADTACYVRQTPPFYEMEDAWSSLPGISWSSAPILGNLNPQDDSIPEIVVAGLLTGGLYIFSGDGQNLNAPDTLALGQSSAYGPPIMADVDGNGVPELIFVNEARRIVVYTDYQPNVTPCMQLLTVASDTVREWVINNNINAWSSVAMPSVADFNNDGMAEIYAGNSVFGFDWSNPAQVKLKQLLNTTAPWGHSYESNTSNLNFVLSSAADLLSVADCNGDPDCAGLEIACAYGIYSIDIDPNDGDGLEIKLKRNLRNISGRNFRDGATTVADLNLDGQSEVIFTTFLNAESGVCVWNASGFWRFFPMPLTNNTKNIIGEVAVGNVFDDRQRGFAADWPDILIRRSNAIYCFNLNAYTADPLKPYWWRNLGLLEPDAQALAAPVLFDFDNDGYQELVVQDRRALHIVHGGNTPLPPYVGLNNALSELPLRSENMIMHPAIGDANADGPAEIITLDYSAVPGNPWPSLHVVQAKNPDYSRWAPARSVWNKSSYIPWQIEDDLKLPQEAIPAPANRYENTALAQTPRFLLPDQSAIIPTADLSIRITEVECRLPQFEVTYEVCNYGVRPSDDTTLVRFYRNGNPFSSAIANPYFSSLSATQPIAPGACITQTELLPLASGTVYAVLNDGGTVAAPLPADGSSYRRPECDFSNNVAPFTMSLSSATAPNLGPDKLLCNPAPVVLSPGAGFTQYLWQNGATSPTITVSNPGVYWVQTRDVCLNTRRDTIVISSGAEQQNLQVAACVGSSYNYNGTAIAAGATQSFTYTNSLGCDSIVQVQVNALSLSNTQESISICAGESVVIFGQNVNTAGLYTQIFQNINGCDSIHSITVNVFPEVIPTQESVNICAGETVQVFGQLVSSAGVFSQTFQNINGCDSIHSVSVNVFPEVIPTQESISICAGETVQVFGQTVSSVGVFSQTFQNINGCDSIHSVTVNVFPEVIPTQENVSICAGESVVIFGQNVNTAGLYTQTFQNTNGCDSIHSVTVNVFPEVIPTQESVNICAGESVQVFGQMVSSAGVFSQTFQNINGCDSIHSITVNVFLEVIPTQESINICAGETVQVFGQMVSSAGIFSQTFQNTNGCDSIHSVTVNVFPEVIPTQESVSICAGESVVIFGQNVNTAGLYTQTFQNTNSCDSIHSVTVNVLPEVIPTQESINICAGETVQVFGQTVSSAGIFSQTFQNTNGCDSIHSITVNVFPEVIPTQESINICAGETVQVFGQMVSSAGIFSQTFQNTNGCDSIHSITVNVLPEVIPTQAQINICQGDSIQLFGQTVYTSGVYTAVFQNNNGCDSTHTVQLQVVPLLTAMDSLELCPGDSLFWKNNWYTQPGDYQQFISSVNACDTLWRLHLKAVTPPPINFTLRQPDAADTTGALQLLPNPTAGYSLDGLVYGQDSLFTGLAPGSYVIYQQFQSCTDTAQFVIFPFIKTPEQETDAVYLPNVFAPDSGNENAIFQPFFNTQFKQNINRFSIYDRWGEILLDCRDVPPQSDCLHWDGRFRGRACQPGVYTWLLEWTQADGTLIFKSGTLTLIR